MKPYRHVLFDLDHTLWDFRKNAQETLHELYETYHLSDTGRFSAQQFCDTFEEVNRYLWQQYNAGRYDQQRLRSERFVMILERLGLKTGQVSADLADAYLRICPTKSHVMPHTVAILDYLSQHYRLHILTNGFAEVQAIKLASAQLTGYFDTVVCSDTTGHKKPHRPVFDYTLQQIDADSSACVMIGDNLQTDIRGGREAGIDQIFYNPGRIAHREATTYEIACLSELRDIL